MRYRLLGETGLRVSEVGFGTIPILKGDVGVLPAYYHLELEPALALMEQALERGCNLFDTAIVPEYGDAEEKLGHFARRVGREKLVLSDKARCFSGHEMYEAVCRSVQTLGTCPDVYFVHQVDPGNAEEVFGTNGALDALVWCKREGKIRFAGVATHYYDLLLRAARDPRVDVIQGSGNLLERGMLDRMEREAAFRGKGFLLNKVYAAGILPRFFTSAELIQGVLTYPISSALVGLGTQEELQCALEAAEGQGPGQRPSFSQILARLKPHFDPIPCCRCQRCACPYGVEPHILFRQYNYFFLGKDYWALRKLSLDIASAAARCRSCLEAPCRTACPQRIRIPQSIQLVEQLVRRCVYRGVI